MGNGDGIIDGYNFTQPAAYPVDHTGGEQEWFWEDLSANAGLIEGMFNTGIATEDVNYSIGDATGTKVALFLPAAKLGGGNYFSVNEQAGVNYFTLSTATFIGATNGNTNASVGLTVAQSAAIDGKIDDGFPQSGRVMANYGNANFTPYALSWAAGGGVVGISPGNAAAASLTSCYDNGGNASNTMTYSMTTNNGTGVNCALSFQFQ